MVLECNFKTIEMEGFTKFILNNHPDPDNLIDCNADGSEMGRIHTEMTKLANAYANQRVIEELENIPYFDVPLSKEEMVTSNYIAQRIKELRPTPLPNNDEPTNSDDGY